MNTNKQILRVAALASAMTLFTGYVYQQAGGKLLEKLGVVEAKTPAPAPAPAGTVTTEVDPMMFAGSKSAAVAVPESPSANVFPGSKSLIIGEPLDPQMAAEIQRLLPGSKSEVLAPSFFETQPEAQPQQQRAQPQQQRTQHQAQP